MWVRSTLPLTHAKYIQIRCLTLILKALGIDKNWVSSLSSRSSQKTGTRATDNLYEIWAHKTECLIEGSNNLKMNY